MTLKITGIFSRGENGIAVCFEMRSSDGKHTECEKFLISANQLARLQLSKGDVSEELYDTVAYEAKLYEAARRALKSLEYGSCSKKTLYVKLLKAGFDKEISAQTVELMSKDRLLNDSETACREAERALKKLWGRRRIEAELFKKGYESDDVRGALEYLDGVGADYVVNCEKLISQKFRRSSPSPDEVKKLYPSLVRYGYSPSEIKAAMVRVLGENE